MIELLTIPQLAKRGINSKKLYAWYKQGLLKPTVYSGTVPHFTENDFLNACKAQQTENHIAYKSSNKSSSKRESILSYLKTTIRNKSA